MMTVIPVVVVWSLAISVCVQAGKIPWKRYVPEFHNAEQVATVNSHYITEASGLCASRTHKNVLYTHNDSGDTHRIYAIDSTNGNRLALITIDGTTSRDWEDIACGPCTGGTGNCIYVADTGGNTGSSENTIYRIQEPASLHDQSVTLHGTLQYSWDQHDCETVMVDPNGEVYVVSKVLHGKGKVVHLPSSAWNAHHRVQVNDGVHLSIYSQGYGPVGGDINRNGHEVLLKTYGHVYYWYVPDGNLYSAMTRHPTTMPYHSEQQGEAVCFDAQGSGYYTLSEGSHSPLYYYRRKSDGGVVG